MDYIKREKYLATIRGFYKSDIIKVITGIRRCGKSCIMRLVVAELLESGVAEKDVIFLDLDSRRLKKIKTADQLDNLIQSSITDDDFKYLFIDEIQNVKDFEEVINSYNNDGNISIFLTGSNSYLLSGQIATKLTGRYIEFEIFPLDFSEYLEMKEFRGLEISNDRMAEFQEYILNGGFPKSLEFNSIEDRRLYTKSVVNEIFEKDIKRHNKIRHRDVFEKVQNYIIANFGATFSIDSIFQYFENQEKLKIKKETIRKYIDILEAAKIIYKCKRFDIKSKKSLRGEEKYYLADLGLYFSLVTGNRINFGPVLENLVFLHLLQNRYSVSVGRIGNLECDFIARKDFDKYFYIQVSLSVVDQNVEDREYKPFYLIKDNFPKILLTLDGLQNQKDGVIHKNIIDLFLQKNITAEAL